MAQKVFLANSLWEDNSEQKERFIKNGIWEASDQESIQKYWDLIEEGDLLILCHTDMYQKYALRVITSGLVDTIEEKKLLVKWNTPSNEYELYFGLGEKWRDLVLLQRNQIEKIADILSKGSLKKKLETHLENSEIEPVEEKNPAINVQNENLRNTSGEVETKNFEDTSGESFERLNLLMQSSFFLAEYRVGQEDLSAKFLKENSWGSFGPKNRTDSLTGLKQGDVLILKSCYRKEELLMMNIRGVGMVINDDYTLKVQVIWESFNSDINVPNDQLFTKKFIKVPEEYIAEILGKIAETNPSENKVRFQRIEQTLLAQQGANSSQLVKYIQSKISEESKFWWYNDQEKTWGLHTFEQGGTYYGLHVPRSRSLDWRIGELILLFDVKGTKSVAGIMELTNFLPGHIEGKLIYEFKKWIKISDLKKLELFKKSGILQKSRTAIIEISADVFQEIINTTELGQSNEDEILHIQNIAQKTKIDNDGAMAPKDFLGFENDIRAFSITLAQKRLVPPVAVALFGNWGTGKSFFMHHLEKNIKRLSDFQSFYGTKTENKPVSKPFCEGVVHIKFNAWSYLDTNLWAGLIATIFEKLDEYVSGENVIQKEKHKAQKIIADKLDIVAHEKENLKVEINKLTSKQELLAKELKQMQANKKSMYDSVISKTIEDLKKEAKKETREIEAEVKKQLDQYGISKQRVDELSPSTLLDELTTWVTFVKHLGKFNKQQLGIGIGLVFLLGWFAIDPGSYLAEFKQQINNSLIYIVGIGGGLFSKCYDSFSKFKQLLTPVIDYKNRFNESFERVKLNYDQSLLTLSNQLEASNSEILDQERKLSEVEQKIEKYNHALEHSVTKRAFFDFIKRKANEESYESHLGLISIIRRDFEKLSGLFEEVNIPEDAMPEVKEELVEKKKENKEFRELFSKPLDRIILYIDDLDRCDDDKVLEVLEAVHLLMAFPLFIVIVGVDKRCVSNALRYRNILKYTSMAKVSPKQLKDDYNIEVIEPEEYLEKIFQIPFRLKAAKPDAIKGLIGNLLRNEIEVIEETEEEDKEQEEKADNKTREKEVKSTVPKPKSKPTEPPNVAPEDLLFTQTELDYLKEVSIVVGDTPRTIKRFINIYRIIRAHEQLNYRRKEKDLDFLIIMFVLGLGIGNQRDRSSIIFDNCMANKSKNLKDVLELNEETKSLVADLETSQTLKLLLSVSASQFNNYINFVNRFSFT